MHKRSKPIGPEELDDNDRHALLISKQYVDRLGEVPLYKRRYSLMTPEEQKAFAHVNTSVAQRMGVNGTAYMDPEEFFIFCGVSQPASESIVESAGVEPPEEIKKTNP
jgi:hypothetical protein